MKSRQRTTDDKVLNGTSPLTLFAPTNSAFAKVGNETLDGLLMDPDALSDMEPDAEADTVGKADDDTPAE